MTNKNYSRRFKFTLQLLRRRSISCEEIQHFLAGYEIENIHKT